MHHDARNSRRGSALILFTLLMPTLMLMVGMAVDFTIVWIVEAKLSEAVDGAALGSGRLLGTQADTDEIATEFLEANFPTGYWGSYDLTPHISSTTVFSTHTINVAATVNVPLLFGRILHWDHFPVSATAVATRRDTRVELVLDRSASMSSNIGSLRTAATQFTNMFTPDVDELGLVVFGGSAFVAYPTTVSLSSTGPDVHFADTPTSGNDNMLTIISAIKVGTDTGSAEGLWLAYQELKTANTIDSDPSKLNAIVFFTDGVPNGFSAYINNATTGMNALASKSFNGCNYNPSAGASQDMKGWVAATGSGSGLNFFRPTGSNAAKGTGVYTLATSNTHSAKYLAGTGATDDMTQLSGTTPFNGCKTSGSYKVSDLSFLSKIPPQDLYGNSTSGAAVPDSLLYKTFNTNYNANQPTSGYQVALASWNAIDNAAQTILADTTLNTAIYCIGYTGNGGVDATLLKRIANTKDSNNYTSAWQTGLYVEAGNSTELETAFNTVASSILRLAR